MELWNKEKIADSLIEAGKIAFLHFDSTSWEFKKDRSLVTVADREIESYFSSCLEKPDSDIYLLGEETIWEKGNTYIENAFKKTAYIVDPIDGTAPYVHHLPSWGISIGLMQDSSLKEGALYLPYTRDLLVTEKGSLFISKVTDQGAELKPYKRPEFQLSEGSIVSLSQGVCKRGIFNARNPVLANGSCVFSLAHLVMGSFMAYIATVRIWDIAGSLPVLDAAGFIVQGMSGKDIGLEMTDEFYELDPQSGSNRYKLKESAICAPTAEAVEYVRKHTVL